MSAPMEHTNIAFQVLALTGGSGAGKGVVSEILQTFGIPVLDTDKVSRIVYEAGQPCLAALTDAFGTEILTQDGCLDRAALAALVFGEQNPEQRKEKLSRLNAISHRYILDYSRSWLTAQKKAGFPAACIDAPQLFESGFDRESDYIIGVTADREIRIRRIIARDGISRERAEQRLAAQHDDAFFDAHCDTVLVNNGERAALIPKVREILALRGLLS